jgi:hypothetical protein
MPFDNASKGMDQAQIKCHQLVGKKGNFVARRTNHCGLWSWRYERIKLKASSLGRSINGVLNDTRSEIQTGGLNRQRHLEISLHTGNATLEHGDGIINALILNIKRVIMLISNRW